MHGSISDSEGRRAWRLLPYVLPALMLGLATLLSGVPAAVVVLSSFAVFNLIGLLRPFQRETRTAEFECGPGYVDVKNAGTRSQRIYAKDVTGATTARTSSAPAGKHLFLTLQHRDRAQPITLHVANDAEAERIRHALGIGHSGFGTLAWRTTGETAAIFGRLLAVLPALITIAVTLCISPAAGAAVGVLLGWVGFIGALVGLVGLFSKGGEPTILMTSEGLRLRTARGWFAIPYDAIERAVEHPNGFVFQVPPPYGSVGVERASPALGGLHPIERQIFLSQVKAAAARARGFGPQKNDVSGRVDVLRRKGESARDWLVRLDMAGQMLAAGPGYRGNTLDLDDLWTLLEDPEADAELRAAAARVLRHAPTPDARVRIAAAVAAVRDESASRRLRVAIRDDLDHASQELNVLDQNESHAAMAMAMRR